jgi:SAM-dependent methyltransferase
MLSGPCVDIVTPTADVEGEMERAEYEAMHRLESRMWWYRGLHALVCQLLAHHASRTRRMLDAGCGTGGTLEAVARALPGSACFGLEVDPQAAELAGAKSGAAVAVGSVNAMPIAAASLGALVCLDVLPHQQVDPERALQEMHRCLESGGFVVLNLPAYAWMLSAHDRRVHNVRRFNRRQARALLQAAGLRVVRASHWNMLLFPLMAIRRLVVREGAASDVQEYPPLIDAVFSAALAVERLMIGWGIDLPFGGSIVVVAVKE